MSGSPFRFGWGWTIGSLFIPFWNFYRPWVGFAEVRRAAGIAARQRVSLEWKSDGFRAATLALGLGYFLGSIALQCWATKTAEGIAAKSDFGLDAVERLARPAHARSRHSNLHSRPAHSGTCARPGAALKKIGMYPSSWPAGSTDAGSCRGLTGHPAGRAWPGRARPAGPRHAGQGAAARRRPDAACSPVR